MRKSTAIVLILITLAIVCPEPLKAQQSTNITINADGNISPATAPIQRNGDIYTLTGDVIGSISVMRSNMTFDGNGHSLIAIGDLRHGIEGLSVGINAYSAPPVITGATNVTIKNLNARGGFFGISLGKTTNSIVTNNTITETGNAYLSLDQQTAGIYVDQSNSNIIKGNTLSSNYNGILFVQSTNNLIIENNITKCYNPWNYSAVGISFWEAKNNTVYHNNLINNTMQAYGGITIAAAGVAPLSNNTWDNGFPSGGNYWSDYQTKYPNASMIENSGIGNTPYYVYGQNKDRYPLMEPFYAVVSEVSNSSSESPTASTQWDSLTTVTTVVGVLAVIIAIIAGLAVYFAKRRR